LCNLKITFVCCVKLFFSPKVINTTTTSMFWWVLATNLFVSICSKSLKYRHQTMELWKGLQFQHLKHQISNRLIICFIFLHRLLLASMVPKKVVLQFGWLIWIIIIWCHKIWSCNRSKDHFYRGDLLLSSLLRFICLKTIYTNSWYSLNWVEFFTPFNITLNVHIKKGKKCKFCVL
jgi:hypothetical protein